MKHIKYLIYFIALFTFLSCEKQVKNFELKDFEPSIVMNSIIRPDSIIKVHVSQSIGGLDPDKTIAAEDIKLELIKNGDFIDMLEPLGNNYYGLPGIKPETNAVYEIKARSEKLGEASCTFELPQKPEITDIDTSSKKIEIIIIDYNGETWVEENHQLNLDITINDRSEKKDYYMISVLTYNKQYIFETQGWQIVDSFYTFTKASMDTKDNYIEMTYDGYNVYPVEMEDEIWGHTFILSDDLFNGKTHTFNVSTSLLSTRYKIVVYSISEDYYKFFSSFSKYSDNPFENFFSERTSVYTNVNDGLGLIGTMNMSVTEIDQTVAGTAE